MREDARREAALAREARRRGLRLRRSEDRATGDVEWWTCEPDGRVVDGTWSTLDAVEAALREDD